MRNKEQREATMNGNRLRAYAVICCFSVLSACEQTAETTPAADTHKAQARYSAEAFYETTSYGLSGKPSWSKDGSTLLIGSDKNGTFNVYGLDVKNGHQRAMTTSTENAQYPVSWFPDDERVLVSADTGGNELTHLYVREQSGEMRDLTPGEGLKAVFAGWSANRQHFYISTNERLPKAFDLYRYSVKDYQRELIFANDAVWSIEAVSKNQRYLALGRENSNADNNLYLLDLQRQNAVPQLLTPHQGPVQYYVHGFSPDSAALLYGTDQQGEFVQSWRYVIDSSTHEPLGHSDWSVRFVFFSDSGRYRVRGTNEDARMVIEIIDTRSGQAVSLPDLPQGQLGQVRFSPDEKSLALTVSSDTSPRDIYLVDLETSNTHRLTSALNPALDESRLVSSSVVRYKSFDGLEIPAILYQPASASSAHPAPALVWVHGGPGGQNRVNYSAMHQHLVNQGYAVLAVNNRGSSGYGKTFFHMDDRKHGEVDLDDIVYAEKYLAGLDWVDPERIGVIGRSYGGYMVGAALAFRPGVFKVGINIFGVMNWVRTLESIPPYWEAFRKQLYTELGDPAVDGERLRRISPLFHAENIKTPLLVIQGANDPRVLQVESDEIVAAVRANGVPVEYLIFPDEGHGFSQRSNRIAASKAFVAFLDKYLR